VIEDKRVPSGWREEKGYWQEPGVAQMAVPQPPSLLMRVEALHRLLSQIDATLEGHSGIPTGEDPSPALVAASAEVSVGRIGEGLDEAFSRLEKLRERLLEHMMALR